jgi:hypothetical protein
VPETWILRLLCSFLTTMQMVICDHLCHWNPKIVEWRVIVCRLQLRHSTVLWDAAFDYSGTIAQPACTDPAGPEQGISDIDLPGVSLLACQIPGRGCCRKDCSVGCLMELGYSSVVIIIKQRRQDTRHKLENGPLSM